MPTSEEQQNLAAITEYFTEYWGKGNVDIVDKLCSDNFVINYPMHGPRYGREGAKKMLREFKEVSRLRCYDFALRLCADSYNNRHSQTSHFMPISIPLSPAALMS